MKIAWTTSEINETLLIIHATVWGFLLLLPGDSFSSRSQVDLLSTYAPDTIWGVLLLSVNLPTVAFNRYKYRSYRKFVHVFNWTFWLAITSVAIYRTAGNGLSITDILLILPFFTIALLHGIIYAGLEKEI